MSLPPQMLRIKRKRREDPVDALYLETTQTDQKRRATVHAFVFRRLHDQPATLPDSPQPAARSSAEGSTGMDTESTADNNSSSPAAAPETQRDASNPRLPRRFYLSRDALQADTSVTGKRKSSGHEPSLATFVAEHARTRRLGSDGMNTTSLDHQRPENGVALRKKPKTRAMRREKKVVAESTVDNISVDTQEAMQRYAKDLDSQNIPPASHSLPQQDVGDDAMDTSDDEYTYDTYLRYTDNWAALGKTPEGHVGYLIIPEADQTLWETYYDSDADSEDERDWDSEQDDENAENFYGADYPEDEVDSSDELDGDPYRYHRGSDDEEYGSEDDAWSHGEPEKLSIENVAGLGRM